MLFNRTRLFNFSIKKVTKQPGIIIDPQQFRTKSFFGKLAQWFRTRQTLGDLQRTFKGFNRHKSLNSFIFTNNNLIESIQKRNLRQVETFVSDDYFKQLKTIIKNNGSIPSEYSLFIANKANIVQARSFTETLLRTRTTDHWYQLTVELENTQNEKKVYHVMQRYIKDKEWRFIKFNI